MIALVSAGLNIATAQVHKILDFPNSYNCDTSVVRYWDGNQAVVYASSPKGKMFYLMDANSTNVASIATSLHVKDMEIVGDTLYYCGIGDDDNAYIGFFTIPDLLTSNLPEKLVTIPLAGSNNDLPLRPKRMEVFHVNGGFHVVMVCDVVLPSDTIKRVMMDARSFYGNSTWAFNYAFPGSLDDDLDNIWYPDDVAITDNYIVFIGHKHCSAGIYIKKAYKPNNTTDFFIYTSSTALSTAMYAYFGDCYILGQSDGEHPVWGTHLKGDTIAVAFMCNYKPGTDAIYGAVVMKIFQNPIDTINDTCTEMFFPYSQTLNKSWRVKDLRYDEMEDKLLMLYDADNPIDGTIENMAMVIDNMFPNNVESFYINVTKAKLFSIDRFTPFEKTTITSGTTSGNRFISTLRHTANDLCSYKFKPYSIPAFGHTIQFDVDFNYDPHQAMQFFQKASVLNSNIIVFCE